MIIHICDTATVRVFKEIYALQSRGWNVLLLYRNCQHRDLLQLVGQASLWTDSGILRAKLSSVKNQVIHVHTSINSAPLIEEVAPHGKRNAIVWDIHDLVEDSKIHFDKASAIVIPSIGYADMITHESKTVLYSKVPFDWLGEMRVPENNSCLLVSEVCHSGMGPEWRDYSELQSTLNMPLFIMPANATGWESYSNVMQRLPYLKMLLALQSFKFAWTGAPNTKSDFSKITTNKFWEAVAIGSYACLSETCEEMRQLLGAFEGHEYHGVFAFDRPCYAKKAYLNESLLMDFEIKKLEDVYAKIA